MCNDIQDVGVQRTLTYFLDILTATKMYNNKKVKKKRQRGTSLDWVCS